MLGTICQWMRLSHRNGRACSQQDLTDALRSVHQRIEPLRCILEKDEVTGGSYLTFKPDLGPLIDTQTLPDDYDADEASPKCIEKLVAQEVTKGMGPSPDDAYNKALWRSIVLEDGWVILIFHHSICDGSSRKIFTDRLVKALANPETADEQEIIQLQPSAYDLLGAKVECKEADEKKDDIDTKDDASRAPVLSKKGWPSPDKVSSVPERFNQAPSAIIPNSSSLRDKCRLHGTTVTSAMTAALAMSVRRQMSIPETDIVDMDSIKWAVDVRRHLNNAPLFGCYIFSDGIQNPISIKVEDSIWSLAKEIYKYMVKSSSLDYAHSKVLECKDMMEEPMTPQKLMPLLALIDGEDQGRNSSLNMSNIGLVDGSSSCGNVRVDKMFCITSQTALGSYVWMNAASLNNNLYVTLASVWPTVSEERGRAMLDEFVDILTNCY